MVDESWNPKGILGAAMALNKPASGFQFLFPQPEERGLADLGKQTGPDSVVSPRPPGWDYGSGGKPSQPIRQVDPRETVEGWASGTEPMRGLLDRISIGEGTSDAEARKHPGFDSGYDATYSYQPTPKPLSQMTLNEVAQFQDQMRGPTPVGKYQILRGTLSGLKDKLGLTGGEMFSPDLQDRMGRELLTQRKWNAYVDGRIGPTEFQKQLGTEWDSIEMPGTNLTRSGHTPRTTTPEIQSAIRQIVQYK